MDLPLSDDGSVVSWGSSGGDSSSVSSSLSSGVRHIVGNHYAFSALKDDGSVISWGVSGKGGTQVDTYSGGGGVDVSSELASGVSKIVAAESAFAALKEDGTVVAWGDHLYGGSTSNSGSSGKPNFTGVREIVGGAAAFAGIKDDGTVIAWGGLRTGGHPGSSSRTVFSASGPLTGATQIIGGTYTFAVLKDDGSVVTWGSGTLGGDSSSVASEISSGVVGFANAFTNDVYDSTAPTVQSVSSSTADGTYKAGDTITINVVFSEAVTVTTTGGTPQQHSKPALQTRTLPTPLDLAPPPRLLLHRSSRRHRFRSQLQGHLLSH